MRKIKVINAVFSNLISRQINNQVSLNPLHVFISCGRVFSDVLKMINMMLQEVKSLFIDQADINNTPFRPVFTAKKHSMRKKSIFSKKREKNLK